MYGKIFPSLWTGSMMGVGSIAQNLMSYAVSNCDADGLVELNPQLLAVLFGDPVERVSSSLQYLCQPDPESRTPDENGCRLVREGQFLYRIVNYHKYRSIRDLETRRKQNREAKQRERQRQQTRQPQSAKRQQCQPHQPMSAQAEAEAEAEKISSAAHSHCADAQNLCRSASPQEEPESESPAQPAKPDPDTPHTPEEENFEEARRIYPGKKRGFRVEFENFRKHHADWRGLLDDEGLAECVQTLIDRHAYSPGFWPHFQTFCNQSRYEEALQPPEVKR